MPPAVPAAPLRPKRSVKPKNRKNVIEWFQQEELVKRICYDGDKILPYFHGERTKNIKQGYTICTWSTLQHFPEVDILILKSQLGQAYITTCMWNKRRCPRQHDLCYLYRYYFRIHVNVNVNGCWVRRARIVNWRYSREMSCSFSLALSVSPFPIFLDLLRSCYSVYSRFWPKLRMYCSRVET